MQRSTTRRNPSNSRTRRRAGLTAAAAGVMAGALIAGSAIALSAASGSERVTRTTTPMLTGSTVGKYGIVVGTSTHRSLYTLTKGHTAVACTGACLQYWPPLLVAKGTTVTHGAGIKGKVGTVPRGTKEQVTLNGWPLYTFVGDTAARQSHGEGIVSFGGTWYLAKASATTHDGTPVLKPTTSSGGGGGW